MHAFFLFGAYRPLNELQLTWALCGCSLLSCSTSPGESNGWLGRTCLSEWCCKEKQFSLILQDSLLSQTSVTYRQSSPTLCRFHCRQSFGVRDHLERSVCHYLRIWIQVYHLNLKCIETNLDPVHDFHHHQRGKGIKLGHCFEHHHLHAISRSIKPCNVLCNRTDNI